MTRDEFEAIRDLPGKQITADIHFSKRKGLHPAVAADNVPILNEAGVDLRLSITYNPETGAKSINVHCPAAGGPICRLEVDSTVHRPAGRSHKHALSAENSPARNLGQGVLDRPALAGLPLREIFDIFCREARIEHVGSFDAPDEEPRARP